MTEDSKLVQMRMTNEQIECMKAYFLHYDWSFNPEYLDMQAVVNTCTAETDIETRNYEPLILPNSNFSTCDHCLCSPCVLDKTNRQTWWPSDNFHPKKSNSTKRKILYKKFWTMLCHRGVFNDPIYVERKSSAIARDRQRNYYMWHNKGTQRDLLPNCVVQKVRAWCPNPPNMQYMGHLWF